MIVGTRTIIIIYYSSVGWSYNIHGTICLCPQEKPVVRSRHAEDHSRKCPTNTRGAAMNTLGCSGRTEGDTALQVTIYT